MLWNLQEAFEQIKDSENPEENKLIKPIRI